MKTFVRFLAVALLVATFLGCSSVGGCGGPGGCGGAGMF